MSRPSDESAAFVLNGPYRDALSHSLRCRSGVDLIQQLARHSLAEPRTHEASLSSAGFSLSEQDAARVDRSSHYLDVRQDINRFSRASAVTKAQCLGVNPNTPGVPIGITVATGEQLYGSWEDMHIDIRGLEPENDKPRHPRSTWLRTGHQQQTRRRRRHLRYPSRAQPV